MREWCIAIEEACDDGDDSKPPDKRLAGLEPLAYQPLGVVLVVCIIASLEV
jgi:hypothetical protein